MWPKGDVLANLNEATRVFGERAGGNVNQAVEADFNVFQENVDDVGAGLEKNLTDPTLKDELGRIIKDKRFERMGRSERAALRDLLSRSEKAIDEAKVKEAEAKKKPVKGTEDAENEKSATGVDSNIKVGEGQAQGKGGSGPKGKGKGKGKPGSKKARGSDDAKRPKDEEAESKDADKAKPSQEEITDDTRKNKPRPVVSGEEASGDSAQVNACLLYTSPSPRDRQKSRMPSSA